jgi:prepilin-type N-terminal cleavage/methylation domain-containing protein
MRRRCSGFTLVELTAAIAILSLLFGCFYSAMHGVEQAHDRFIEETYAVLVLGNVVERARVATPPRDAAGLEAILLDEYERSPLSDAGNVETVCRDLGDNILVSIMRQDTVVASLEVPR